MDLLEELTALLHGFEHAGIEFALCGGLAMAVYAFPRATLDIDLMIEADSLEEAKRAAKDLGYSLDSGLMRFAGGDVQIHRLCKVAEDSEDELVLDLILVTPATRVAWETRQIVEWEHGSLPAVSPEGLIALKSLRGSGQDQDDIAALRTLIDED